MTAFILSSVIRIDGLVDVTRVTGLVALVVGLFRLVLRLPGKRDCHDLHRGILRVI